jgi:outer membrane lipoprotein-sorting protein
VVQNGENLVTIAYKLFVSDYMIMSVNSDIDGYYDVKPGQKIKVPNAYARKTFLFIDKETYLPVVQIMYDEKGLFSKYEFTDVKVNPKFSDVDFSKENDQYDF